MNNRFLSEAKLPWSYDYPLANHIATNESSANREMPLFSRLYPSFGYLRKIFPPSGLEYFLFISRWIQGEHSFLEHPYGILSSHTCMMVVTV